MKHTLKQCGYLLFWVLFLGLASAVMAQTMDFEQSVSGSRSLDGGFTDGNNQTDRYSLPVVRTSRMNINYLVNMPVHMISQVELWYGQGWQGTWQLYDFDTDKTSPIEFKTPSEGIYRFLVVVVDQMGRKSCLGSQQSDVQMLGIPDSVPSQQVVFIDYTPPKLYLQNRPVLVERYDKSLPRELRIRWSGFDAHLEKNPVRLHFQTQVNGPWEVLSLSQPPTGEYVWELPPEMSSSIRIKVELTDQAGHKEIKYTDWVYVGGNDAGSQTPPVTSIENKKSSMPLEQVSIPPKSAGPPQQSQFVFKDSSEPAVKTVSPAENYYQRGVLHSQRAEWDRAIAAFRKALEEDNAYMPARLKLGKSLYRMNQFDEAQEQFSLYLKDQPDNLPALYDLALTYAAMNQYELTRKTVEQLIRKDPYNGQAWLLHGDASAQLGLKEEAIKSWEKATQSDLSFIVRAAQERLESLQP
ncbi:MAG: tetratricopeptide repeat protein [Sedimentisphaerales bacterium]|nr:tetratricopeptide repeat protein [Sedimentisphaerales bacterium]